MDFSENITEDSSIIALQKALSGDDSAWDCLFEYFHKIIRGAIFVRASKLGGAPLIDDIMQSVFLRLMEKKCKALRSFDLNKGSSLERYVARIANNCLIDYIRQNKKHFRNVDLSYLPESRTEPDTFLPKVEIWEITAALNTLSTRERQIIILFFKKHISMSEIAETLDITVETVRTTKFHAIKKLKKYFGEK